RGVSGIDGDGAHGADGQVARRGVPGEVVVVRVEAGGGEIDQRRPALGPAGGAGEGDGGPGPRFPWLQPERPRLWPSRPGLSPGGGQVAEPGEQEIGTHNSAPSWVSQGGTARADAPKPSCRGDAPHAPVRARTTTTTAGVG